MSGRYQEGFVRGHRKAMEDFSQDHSVVTFSILEVDDGFCFQIEYDLDGKHHFLRMENRFDSRETAELMAKECAKQLSERFGGTSIS